MSDFTMVSYSLHDKIVKELEATLASRDATIKTQGEEIERLRGAIQSVLMDAASLGMESAQDCCCAQCGEPIAVGDGMEWNDGDWCWMCWQTWGQKAMEHLGSALAPGVKAARELEQ